jgi:hypothetical protein
MNHFVLPPDVRELRGEGANASSYSGAAQNKRVHHRVLAQHFSEALVRGDGRLIQHDQQIEIGDAFNPVSSNDAAIDAAGVKIGPELFAQGCNNARCQ